MATALEVLPTASPYPGLRPFLDVEGDIFFGREEQIDQLIKRLKRSRFLAVVGPSGCGKSSLVRAGLISNLKAGIRTGLSARWWIADMRPSEAPLEGLAKALLSQTVLGNRQGSDREAVAFMRATLRRGPLGIIEALREKAPPKDANLLILVDQFEEIFRFRREGNADEADAFVALLLASAAQEEFPVYVVITMRSDFLGDCALFSGLPEVMNDSQFLTPRLMRDQTEAAIVNPACVSGGKAEPLLVNRMLNDMGSDPDHLPLLQHALMRMWRRASEARRSNDEAAKRQGPITISLEDYIAVGTITDALSNHAEEVFKHLSPRKKHIAKVMFCRLTERGLGKRDTRRPARLGEIVDLIMANGEDNKTVVEEEIKEVIEEFRQPDRSFIMPPFGEPLNRETMLDIGHESLIRQWKLLNKWIDEEARSVVFYQRLKQWASLWAKGEAEPWTGTDLERALEWKKHPMSTREWAARYGSTEDFEMAMKFIDASQAKREKLDRTEKEKEERRIANDLERARLEQKAREFRKLAMVLAIAFLLLSGIGVWGYTEYRDARTQRERAEYNSKAAQMAAEEANQQRSLAEQAAKTANEQAELAKTNAMEAKRQEKKAVANEAEARLQKENALSAAKIAKQQEDIARLNEIEARRQKRVADENAAEALRQKAIAEQAAIDASAQKKKAEESAAEAVRQKSIAEQAVIQEREQKKKAEESAAEALKQKRLAEEARDESQKALEDRAEALRYLQQQQQLNRNNAFSITEQLNLIKQLKSGLSAVSSLWPSSPTSGLRLKLTDVYERPLDVHLKVDLHDQIPPKEKDPLKDLSFKSIKVNDLIAVPQGVYKVDITAPSYLSVSNFINLSTNKPFDLKMTVPLDPNKIDRVIFKDYESLPEEIRQLFERSTDIPGFEVESGKDLYEALDDVHRAGLLNIMAKCRVTRLENGRTILSYLQKLTALRKDYLFAVVENGLPDNLAKSQRFRTGDVSGILDESSPGFARAGSFKTREKFGGLQLTFFTKEGETLANIDIDEAGAFGEVFRVPGNLLTGRITHPYEIHQILVYQGINSFYRLKP